MSAPARRIRAVQTSAHPPARPRVTVLDSSPGPNAELAAIAAIPLLEAFLKSEEDLKVQREGDRTPDLQAGAR